MDTAEQKVGRRAAVESKFNRQRHAIEEKYVADRDVLESKYHDDLAANQQGKREALVAAGLNPDGSDPQERPQGLAE